jgi:sugar/nucleoside kinase (ribokinase family)
MRVAVVGHVEWIEFAEVDHVPVPGEIVHAERTFQLPAGGGAVAAVQLAKLAGSATLFTAFGDDEFGHRAESGLRELGLDVECVFRPETQRRGFVHLDRAGERTITVLGPRLGPRGDDPLPWERLEATDAVYLTAGDAEAIRHARRAGAAHAHRVGNRARRPRFERQGSRRALRARRAGSTTAVRRADHGILGRRVGDAFRRAWALGARAAAGPAP